jgi:glycosyltransferase involved in cell wall biosynthesis
MTGNKKNILYVSNVCESELFDEILIKTNMKPGQAAQKFQYLLLEGFSRQEEISEIKSLSILPTSESIRNKIVWYEKSVAHGKIEFSYVPLVKIPLLKDLVVFIYTFFKVFGINLKSTNSEKIVIANVLNLVVSVASITACRLSNTKCIALVTDLPKFMNPVDGGGLKLKYKIYKSLANYFIDKYDGYVLLTEQMNVVVNPKGKPHLIMEGLVDINMKEVDDSVKSDKRVILYAGALYVKYGVKNLIDAFTRINDNTIELHLYGIGDIIEQLPSYQEKDSRIKYFGVVPNSQVVKALAEATLLINPRPTHEEFTKYSFPSKNVEYMVSGTPLVCTNLPGMPREYHDYIYVLLKDDAFSIEIKLKELLTLSAHDLAEKGKIAKQFVLKEKSNIYQTKRISNFINTLS